MNLGDMIDITQIKLDDLGIHYTTSGVSTAINEGQQLTSILTLCYEKWSDGWDNTIVPYQQFIPVPSDCIVPIHVRDNYNGSQVYPVSFRHFELESHRWWDETGSYYKSYTLFNPAWSSGVSTDQTSYSLIVKPKIDTTVHRLRMIYAADPPTLSGRAAIPKVPRGHEGTMIDYAMFLGTVRQVAMFDDAMEYLDLFFKGVGELNETMVSRYPEGRDFEPDSIERILRRTNLGRLKEPKRGKRE